jgi:CelD/BcsL family acetyltransferase involved in cellulose biosynthesis
LPDSEYIIPWEADEWDEYVAGHPAATVYHTSPWCRVVTEAGRYEPRFLITRRDGRITGLLPALEVRSRLTGNRLVSLPFSDVCFPLVDDRAAAEALVGAAVGLREELKSGFYEMRGAPALRYEDDGDDTASGDRSEDALAVELGFRPQGHFFGYVVPLSTDANEVRMTFSRKSIRQTISKSLKMGVTVRRGEGDADLREFYRLYALNRKRHGIPPQPFDLFSNILGSLRSEPEAVLYMAEFEGACAAALIVLRHKGVAYAKYEGVDETYRRAFPVNVVFWESIRDACESGSQWYDFGRTAADNRGLNEFKSRWGTQQVELPYYFCPPGEGLSVVKSDSLKYRLFTGAFRRMPIGLSVRLGERIFRHFG